LHFQSTCCIFLFQLINFKQKARSRCYSYCRPKRRQRLRNVGGGGGIAPPQTPS